MARKRNPEGNEKLLLIGGIAVAGYLAYTNNLLAGLGLPYTGSTSTPAPTPTPTPAPTAASATNNPIVANKVAAVGTVVHSTADVNAQAQANVPYILPDAATVGQAPSGYIQVPIIPQGGSGPMAYLRSDLVGKYATSVNVLATTPAQGTPGQPGYIPATPGSFDSSNMYQAPPEPVALLPLNGLNGFGSFGGW
jgi:hypothetical protein